MASKLPARTAEKENTDMTDTTPARRDLALEFVDHDEFIDQNAVNAKTNPFQAKINELAQSGRSASVLIPESDEKWAREQIRRAANNVNKGARTKVVPEVHPHHPDVKHVRVHFVVGEMQKRPRS